MLKDDNLRDYIPIHLTIKSSDVLLSPCVASGIVFMLIWWEVFIPILLAITQAAENFHSSLRMRWKAKVLEPAGTGRT